MLHLRTLGALDLTTADGRTVQSVLAQPKRSALFVYLVLASRGGFVRRDTLLALFWPESDASRARNSLSQALNYLRRSLGPEVIRTRNSEEVGVDVSQVRCDALLLLEAIERGDFAGALEIYGGDFLEGLHVPDARGFEDWVELERRRLRQLALRAAWAESERAEPEGRIEDALAGARQALALSENSEESVRRWIELLDRQGDRLGAVQTYEELSARLEAEFGTEPAPETRALMERVLARETPNGKSEPRAPFGTPKWPTSSGVPARVETAPPPSGGRLVEPWRSPSTARIRHVALLGVVALAAFGWGLVRENGGSVQASGTDPDAGYVAVSTRPTVVVAAFENLNPGGEQGAFARSMRGDLLAHLSRLRSLRIITLPSEVESGGTYSEVEILKQVGALGADAVIGGSVQREGDRLRVVARLVAPDGEQLWSEMFDRELTSLFDIQAEIATRVAAALRAELTAEEARVLQTPPTPSITAYEYVQRGFDLLNRGEASTQKELIESWARKALALDPDYADALTLLGEIQWYASAPASPRPNHELQDSALVNARRAVELAPHSVASMHLLAKVEGGSVSAWERVLRLDPTYWRAWYNLVWAHGRGRPGQAYLSAVRLNLLQPHNVHASAILGASAFWLGDWEKAEAWARRQLELQPDDYGAYAILFKLRLFQGRTEEAHQIVSEYMARFPVKSDHHIDAGDIALVLGDLTAAERHYRESLRLQPLPDWGHLGWVNTTTLAYVLQQRGEVEEADSLLEATLNTLGEHVGPAIAYENWAAIHFLQGDPAAGYGWLEKLPTVDVNYDPHHIDPRFERWRDEPRFRRVIGEMRIRLAEQRALVEKHLPEVLDLDQLPAILFEDG